MLLSPKMPVKLKLVWVISQPDVIVLKKENGEQLIHKIIKN